MSTTIITRLYPDAQSADAVRAALLKAGQNEQTIDVVDQQGDAAAARDRMLAARVSRDAADAYSEGVASGKALLVVRAPFFPFGTALNAIRIVDEVPSVDVGVKEQNLYIRDEPGYASGQSPSVLSETPLFLTGKISAGSVQEETISGRFGFALLTKDRQRHSVISGGAFISRKFLPLPLLTRDRHRDSVMHGDAFMSRKILPFPLLTPDRRRDSVMHGEDTTLSSKLGLPLLSGRR